MKNTKKGIKRRLLAILCAFTMLAGIINLPTTEAKAASAYLTASNITATSCHLDWSTYPQYITSKNPKASIIDYSVLAYWATSGGDRTMISSTTATNCDLSGFPAGLTIQLTVKARYYDGNDGNKIKDLVEFISIKTLTVTGPTITPAPTTPVPTAVPTAAPAPAPTTQSTTAPTTTTPATTTTTPATTLSAPVITAAIMNRKTVSIQYYNGSSYGTVIELYNNSGTLVATTSAFYGTATFYGIAQDSVYYAVAYNKDVYGNRSAASESASFIAQPSIKSASCKITKNCLNIKWGKVSGATKYIVYAKTSTSNNWKKVGTTKKTSFKIKKIKGKKVNCNKKYYHVSVVAVKGAKRSNNDEYLYTYKVYK